MNPVIFFGCKKGFMASYGCQVIQALYAKFNQATIYASKSTALLLDSKTIAVDVVIQDDLDYLYAANDPRIFEGFLGFLSSTGSGHAVILRLEHPEYLYFSMEILDRKNPLQLSFTVFGFELAQNSLSRCEALRRLLNDSRVVGAGVHSIDIDAKPPKWLQLEGNATRKLYRFGEPDYEHSIINNQRLTHLKKELDISELDRVILFSGAFFYGKGADLLIEVCESLPTGVKVIFAGDTSTTNYDFSVQERISHLSMASLLSGWIDTETLNALYFISELVVLPYRRTYRYGTSGVFHKAMRLHKPCIVPNIVPFSSVIERYGCGVTFEAGDSSSLSSAIKFFLAQDTDYAANIKNYNNDHISIKDIYKILKY